MWFDNNHTSYYISCHVWSLPQLASSTSLYTVYLPAYLSVLSCDFSSWRSMPDVSLGRKGSVFSGCIVKACKLCIILGHCSLSVPLNVLMYTHVLVTSVFVCLCVYVQLLRTCIWLNRKLHQSEVMIKNGENVLKRFSQIGLATNSNIPSAGWSLTTHSLYDTSSTVESG